jgi:uncharacterized PurR-regulated membrane protein YhhQ (DUF165 family)
MTTIYLCGPINGCTDEECKDWRDAALSFFVAIPALAVASGAAFLLSELADFAVYTPLAKRRFALAVMLSCLVGAAVDSALFLWLAFGSLDHLAGQIIGKAYAALAYLGVRALSVSRRSQLSSHQLGTEK